MKITLCGSLNFAAEMLALRRRLEAKGHEVIVPASITDFKINDDASATRLKADRNKYLYEIKPAYTGRHFDAVVAGDAILVVNLDKGGIRNYVGGATFSEIMLAFYHGKKIFMLNPVPADERLSFISGEIESCRPVILNGNLDLIR